MKPLDYYSRYEVKGTPIYISPEKPDWFVPTAQADYILQLIKEGNQLPAVALQYHDRFGADVHSAHSCIDRLLSRLNSPPPAPYKGRAHYRSLEQLKECWFHLTNQCDMVCKHCMFSSGKGSQPAIPSPNLAKAVDEAFRLGCRLFYFTGGEPLVYDRFTDVCDEVLAREDAHLVILTNGKALENYRAWLKKQPRDRVHFQISIDGQEKTHDAFRGESAFQNLENSIRFLCSLGYAITLAMAVSKRNVQQMATIVDFAHQVGVKNIHYLWLFLKGKAHEDLFVSPESILPELLKAYEQGQRKGVSIDNVEILKSQIFSLPGTRFDLSNAAWESIAVSPDGMIYPSPALIGEQDLAAGSIAEGIEHVWRNSPILEKIRNTSLAQDETSSKNPLRFFIGGGDIDHSYIATRSFVGGDPYVDLYGRVVLYLLYQEAASYSANTLCGMVCRMGERLFECDEDIASIGFTHSNCVLSLSEKDGYSPVRSFYAAAAEATNEDIFNPVCYPETETAHIPEASRIRSYGCGSPVLDCDLHPGEVLVDLGSGAGIECFIASKIVGPAGKVYGIDMLEEMLSIAKGSLREVGTHLGYRNTEFRRGLLENIPIDSESVDVVISNCVINLSPNKRRTFSEIMRILRPGGRLCISDIVSEQDVPLALRYSHKLRGECIGGALKESGLFGLLEDLSFRNMFVLKRFLYREVEGYSFYSVTYAASKPQEGKEKNLYYRGPFAAVITDEGQVLHRGITKALSVLDSMRAEEPFFVLDSTRAPANIKQQNPCCCPGQTSAQPTNIIEQGRTRYRTGCMVCGQDICYLDRNQDYSCSICGKTSRANTSCTSGHYVCDDCHAADALGIIRSLCLQAAESDMLDLLRKIRSYSPLPMHGPDYHPLVAGVILSVYKNRGGAIDDDAILMGIERGQDVPGGACAFMGICGAAIGVGSAFSIILGVDPLASEKRQLVMNVTSDVAAAISTYRAPRCCLRECWTSLKAASKLSKQHLPLYLPAAAAMICPQSYQNQECIAQRCPLWKVASPEKEGQE